MAGRVIDTLKRRLLPTLDQNERLLLMLFYAEGLTAEEISAVLRIPAPEVRRSLESLQSRTEQLIQADGSTQAA